MQSSMVENVLVSLGQRQLYGIIFVWNSMAQYTSSVSQASNLGASSTIYSFSKEAASFHSQNAFYILSEEES